MISIKEGLTYLQVDLVALQYIQMFAVFFEDRKLLLKQVELEKRGKFNKQVGSIFFLIQ